MCVVSRNACLPLMALGSQERINEEIVSIGTYDDLNIERYTEETQNLAAPGVPL